MDVRNPPRASSVIVHRVPPELRERFLELEHGITAAARSFPGYQATDVYPPAAGQPPVWVVVIHFDDTASLRRWLDSPERAGWVTKLRGELGDFHLKTLPGGFAAWFADLLTGPDEPVPPSWKFAVSVLFALYPTVMLLTVFVGPYTNGLGLSLAMLLSNVLSCALLQWLAMPIVNQVLGPWMRANTREQRALSLGGLVVILVLIGGMAGLFRLAFG